VSEEDQISTQSTESDDAAGTMFEQRLEDQIEELLKSDESDSERCASRTRR